MAPSGLAGGEIVHRLSVATYNIHCCVGTDGRDDPDRIADVIRELQVDVVGLQEVGSWRRLEGGLHQVDYLAQATGMTPVRGLRLLRHRGPYGNALLTRRRVLDVRRLELSVARREPRGAIDVDLSLGGSKCRVIVTHLGLRPYERRHQVNRLLAALRETPEGLVVLLGDFNEWFFVGRPLRWLHSHFGRSGSIPTYPSCRPLLALDRIWVQPKEALNAVQVQRTPVSRAASDHLPVRAAIEWRTRSSAAALV
jgi:endonuclease/exonuclease/phosphatase family metal-dependent hydrolase